MNVGKRDYYVITTMVDYDGYDDNIEFITTSYNEAKKRYNYLCDYYSGTEYFDDTDINIDITPFPNSRSRFSSEGGISAWFNDDETYVTVRVKALKTNIFRNPGFERGYLAGLEQEEA